MSVKAKPKIIVKSPEKSGSISKINIHQVRRPRTTKKKSKSPLPWIVLLILGAGTFFAYEPVMKQIQLARRTPVQPSIEEKKKTPPPAAKKVIPTELQTEEVEEATFRQNWLAGKYPTNPFEGSKEGRLESFNAHIKPLFEKHCNRCHGEEKTKGDVDLTLYKSSQQMIENGEEFIIMKETLLNEDMPPKPKKTGFMEEDRKTLLHWITQYIEKKDYSDPIFQDPGPAVIRQLTTDEYNRTVNSLLGINFNVNQEVGIKKETNVKAFSNLAATMQISPLLIEKYFTSADKIIEKLVKDKKALAKLFKAYQPETNSNASKFLKITLSKAYRRSVSASEVKKLYALYLYLRKKKKMSFKESLVRSLKPILVSPFFLNRIEKNQAPENSGEVYQVTDLELANRLSYFLWSTMPDDELIKTAVAGNLSKSGNLESQVSRMLHDHKSNALVENFMEEWLEFGKVRRALPGTREYPSFNNALKNAMKDETEKFIEEIIHQDLSVINFLDSDFTFLNEPLAKHYNIPNVSGKKLQKVILKPEDNRGGILGMCSILAMTSHTNRTKPTARGMWVAEVILGTKIPEPPADIAPLPKDKKGKAPASFREKLGQHVSDASCAVCHKKMDPLGFALDNYDAIGRWRTDNHGQPLDTTGILPNGQKVDGAHQLKDIILSRKDIFVKNLYSKMLSYAIGRNLQYYDELTVKNAVENIKKADYRFSAVILEVVKSRPFMFRKNIENYYASNDAQNDGGTK